MRQRRGICRYCNSASPFAGPATFCLVTTKDALKIANLVEITAEMVWGAKVLGELVPLPDKTRQKMAPIYKMIREM